MEFKKPKFDIKRELLAPPLLGAQPRLVGTAFGLPLTVLC